MSLGQTVDEAKRYEVYECTQDQTLWDAALLMIQEDISAVVVTDDQGNLTGIISRTDLMRFRILHPDWKSLPVNRVMSPKVNTVSPQTTLLEVAQIMLDNNIHRVIAVKEDAGKLRALSVISAADIIYHMVKE